MDTLPLETMYHVALFLPLPSLFQFLQVNHSFYFITEQLWTNRLKHTFSKKQIQSLTLENPKQIYKLLNHSCIGNYLVLGQQNRDFNSPILYSYDIILQNRNQNIDTLLRRHLQQFYFSTTSLFILNENCYASRDGEIICDLYGLQYGQYLCFFQQWKRFSQHFSTICLGKIMEQQRIVGVWYDSYRQFGFFSMINSKENRPSLGVDDLGPSNTRDKWLRRCLPTFQMEKLYRLEFMKSTNLQFKLIQFRFEMINEDKLQWLCRWKHEDRTVRVFVCIFDQNYFVMQIVEEFIKYAILFEIEQTVEESGTTTIQQAKVLLPVVIGKCLFPVTQTIYYPMPQNFTNIYPQVNRFTGNFPSQTYLTSSTNRYFFLTRELNSILGSVQEMQSQFKKIEFGNNNGITFSLSHTNVLTSSISSYTKFQNVSDFCVVPNLYNFQIVLVMLNQFSQVQIFTVDGYFKELLPRVNGSFSQISCTDASYFLLRQDGILFGAGSVTCGRLGILSRTPIVAYPRPLSTDKFIKIKSMYTMTMAQFEYGDTWIYWGSNSKIPFFEPFTGESCYYMDSYNLLSNYQAQWYEKHFEMFYYFEYKKLKNGDTGELYQLRNCVQDTLLQMNATSFFMGTNLLVLDKNGSLFSEDPNFIFFVSDFSYYYEIFKAYIVPILIAVFGLLVCCYMLFCCIRCCRTKPKKNIFKNKINYATIALLYTPTQLTLCIGLYFDFFPLYMMYLIPFILLHVLLVIIMSILLFVSFVRDIVVATKEPICILYVLFIYFILFSLHTIFFVPFELFMALVAFGPVTTSQSNTYYIICTCIYFLRTLLTILWIELYRYATTSIVKIIEYTKTKRAKQLAKIEVDLTQRLLGYEEGKPKLILNKKLFEIPYQELEELSQIGAGGSGSLVFKANWKGKPVAVKLFSTTDETLIQDFENEAEMMMSIRHPNIVTIFGVVVVDRVGLVLQYCAKGSVYKVLQSVQLDSKTKLKWLRQVASAIKYLHDQNVLHRDIKSDNILIDEFDNALVADFGTSKFCIEDSVKNTFSIKGTASYIAPEVVRQLPYGFKADVFSFSIVMYEIVMNTNKPYGPDAKFGIEFKVEKDPTCRPQLPEQFEQHPLFVLMQQCWDDNAEKRPDFAEICQILDTIDSTNLFV